MSWSLVLFLLAAGTLSLLIPISAAAATSSPTDVLKELARVLSAKWTPEAYARLAEFAERQAGTEAGAQAEFALGFSDCERQRFAQARAHFERATTSTVLPDYTAYYLALSLAGLDRAQDAATVLENFEQKHPASPLAREAVKLRAEFLLAAGEPPYALRSLDSYPETPNRADLLLLRARAQEASSQVIEAARTYQKIFYEFPLNDDAQSAGETLKSLKRKLGPKLPAPTAEQRLARVDKLFDAHRYRDARQEYETLARELKGAARARAQVRAGATLYYLRRTAAALERLKRLSPEDPAADAERLATLFQCYRRLEREAELRATLAALAERHPSSPLYEETLFAAANYYFLQGAARDAASHYQILLERFPAGRFAARAHWKLAWQAYLGVDRAAARRLMEEHVARFPNSPHLTSALYWLGRLAEEVGETALARACLTKLGERFPNSYWTSRASERLAKLPATTTHSTLSWTNLLAAIPPPVPVIRADAALPAVAAQAVEQAQALAVLALDDLALDGLRKAYERTQSAPLLYPLLRAAAAAGRHPFVFEMMKRLVPELSAYPLAMLPRELWEIAFPRPYWDLITAEAERNGLDPLFIAALMRQESAFQERAVSNQGAMGLMQVLPKTGRKLARRLRLRYSRARLFDPAYNLRLGAYYYKTLQDIFSGDLARALAGYNAGEDRVAAWQAARSFRDAEEFVESIPFSETRDYVQLVMRNYILYRRLYGSPRASASKP